MSDVDPFVYPIPSEFRNNPETRGYFEYLNIFLHDLWTRTGGPVNVVENIEVTQVTEDGGNRTNRFLIDDIQRLEDRINEIKRRDNAQEIDCIKEQLELIRMPRHRESDPEPERRAPKQDHSELYELIAQLKRQNRTLENKVNELEERLDSGT